MGRSILKFDTPEGPRYLEYSSIVDAPVTYGMSIDEFRRHYEKEYGQEGMRGLDERMARVEATGSSEHGGSLESTTSCNRAGADETEMTIAQMTYWYCVRRGHGPRPRGKRPT